MTRPYILQLLIAIDQLAFVLLSGPFCLVGLAHCPNADETISSFVGRRAIAGQRWARVCEKVINGIFRVLARQHDHCRSSIEWDEIPA